ncbi:hypothetical protein IQ276_016965 [Desmonostoc muscorum LEGE 12446]|uniref:Uncharacterized protein n=1 Tax=Desmonostoc muscorum LEGE 12446 TaxID=1828758 RepID=A0A8J7AEH7_DESMC|nr:hypothetical protein [Desmonostoc muscorum]MCF2148085.1 hypothetical protein [Desmonostoc muscorum LEGE 12446]
MLNQTLHPLKVNGKNIYFEQIYGTALGVQKYTITHGSDVSSSIETITEFWLQTGNGKETQIKLSTDNIKVREGQQVSLIRAYNYIGAYTKSKTSPYYIFINHDFHDWCWLCTPTLFLSNLKVFIFPIGWEDLLILGFLLCGLFIFLFFFLGLSLEYLLFLACFAVFVIVLHIIQFDRTNSALTSTQLEIARMIRKLM